MTGTVERSGGAELKAPSTWRINSTLDRGLAGKLVITLSGNATPRGGLAATTGSVALQADSGASCSGPITTVATNQVTAQCTQSAQAAHQLTITFRVGDDNGFAGDLVASSGKSDPAPPVESPSSSPVTASPSPAAPGGAKAGAVFVIVMENRSYADALATPYVASLAARYGLATNYHSVGSPSLPNYLALTSGSTWGIQDDGYHRLPPGGLGSQLTAAGVTWKSYLEGFTGDCFNSPYPYALKHNPLAYFGGACPSNLVSTSQLQADLAGTTPALSWITPGLCNDGHDCSASVADSWLSRTVPTILSSSAWRNGGVLLITWDEGGSAGDNHVATLVITPAQSARRSGTAYTHYSLLATVEDRLGVGRLGEAAQASPMSDLLH